MSVLHSATVESEPVKPERTLHDRHNVAFRVEKNCHQSAIYPWVVHWPTDPASDYQRTLRFKTHAEAIRRAQIEAFRADLLEKFEVYLVANQNQTVVASPEFDHTGLDTMYRLFQWWGKYDLAGLLENV